MLVLQNHYACSVTAIPCYVPYLITYLSLFDGRQQRVRRSSDNACGDRQTTRVAAVSCTADGRHTMNFTTQNKCGNAINQALPHHNSLCFTPF